MLSGTTSINSSQLLLDKSSEEININTTIVKRRHIDPNNSVAESHSMEKSSMDAVQVCSMLKEIKTEMMQMRSKMKSQVNKTQQEVVGVTQGISKVTLQDGRSIQSIADKVDEYAGKFETLVDVVTRMEQENIAFRNRITNVGKRNVEHNIKISGLKEEYGKNCADKAQRFSKEKMALSDDPSFHVHTRQAFRIGEGRDRSMILNLTICKTNI